MIVFCTNCGHLNFADVSPAPKPLVGLTGQQLRLLNFIHDHMKGYGVAPSYDQMRQALSLRSKSGVNRLIVGLEERGAIHRIPHRVRAIELTEAARKIFVHAGSNLTDQVPA